MDRRNFFKLVGTASGGALTGACGNSARELIPILVPEREIVPGVEQWRPSVCRECSAGCGVIVRLMEGHHKIEQDGETVLKPVAAVKKVEGNPLDPVSGGRLCARGQAAVQRLYHPDRLRGPKKRSGKKGAAEFADATWEEALDAVAALLRDADPTRIVWLGRAESGTRPETVSRFLEALGAEAASTVGVNDFTVERRAAEAVFGWSAPPVYEIQEATYILGLGADFLGGWLSPVLYARLFGSFRQGRPQIRGTLVHAESRFSQTAWAADRWLPVAPGGEQALALALGRLLIEEHGRGADAPEELRGAFLQTDLAGAARTVGTELRRIREIAGELAASQAPLVIGGASIVRTNSFAAVASANALNLILGNVGKPGGVQPPSSTAPPTVYRDLGERLDGAEVVILDGVDPAYTRPALTSRLAGVKTVVSLSSFVDDSAAYADWILPDHDGLESGTVVVPGSSPVAAATGGGSFVEPLHDTRSVEDTLGELARRLEVDFEAETADGYYRKLFESLEDKDKEEWSGAAEFADYAERRGGWSGPKPAPAESAGRPSTRLDPEEARFAGDREQAPFYFQPYPSLQFGDGAGASLPWLQELPDPASSAMWGLPVEIDPGAAAELGVINGDLVRVVSEAGSLEAPVYVNPATIPGVASMAIGQGHTQGGRYAAGRGANPLAVVVEAKETATGAPAFGATRCRIEKVGRRVGLTQFSIVDRERSLVRL